MDDGFLFVQIDDTEFARLYMLMAEVVGDESLLKTIVVKMSEPSGLKMASVRRLGTLPKYKEYIIVAGKAGIRNLRPEYIFKSTWDREYNIWIDGFTMAQRAEVDALAVVEEAELPRALQRIDEICAGWSTRSVSSALKEYDVRVDAEAGFLRENAWRIARSAASSSVLNLARLKRPTTTQRFFSVVSKRDRTVYIVKGDFDESSRQPRVQMLFADTNLSTHPGDLWTDIATTGLEAEGGVEFKNGKKPEALVRRIIGMASKPGDLVLDSFAGSGTTAAVAHKMSRRWITIELGDHCETHIVPRLKKVIDGEDPGGITEAVGWKGGGGYRYYKLAPSLLEKDQFGNWVISKSYNAEMLAEAMCKHFGFTYAPSVEHYWMHGHSSETDFIYVTTNSLTHEQLAAISDEVGPERTLLICCKAFQGGHADAFGNLTIRKIPGAILDRCEWGKDDYSLKIEALPLIEDEPDELDEAPRRKSAGNPNQPGLFNGDEEAGA